MSDEEARAMRAQARRLTVGALVGYPLSLLALLAGIAVLTLLPYDTLFFGMAAAVLFLLTAWLLLAADEQRRRVRALGKDLRHGTLRRFAGRLSHELHDDETVPMLRHRGLLMRGDAEQTLELLSGSRRIVRVNGRPVQGWLTAACTTTVAQPESARIIAQWLDPVDPYDPEVRGGRRDLTEEEKAELRATLRRAWLKPLPLALLLTSWSIMTVAFCLQTGGWPTDWAALLLLALLALTLYVDGYVLHGLFRAWAQRRDLEQGTVTMISSPEQLTEWLTGTHQPWTINGQPASWRLEP